MTRMFFSLILILISASYLAAQNIILLSAAVDNIAINKGAEDVFSQEGEKINNTILNNKIYPLTYRIFYGKSATRQNLLNGFKWIEQTANKDSLVIIYIGTHGNIDKTQGYFCCMADKEVLAYELQPILDRLPCKTLFIIDTCHAAGFMDNWQNHNTFVIAACRSDENANIWNIADPFSWMPTEADTNKNGIIDTEEIYDYLLKHANKEDQHIVASDYRFKSNVIKSHHKTLKDILLIILPLVWMCFRVTYYKRN